MDLNEQQRILLNVVAATRVFIPAVDADDLSDLSASQPPLPLISIEYLGHRIDLDAGGNRTPDDPARNLVTISTELSRVF